VIWWSFFSLAEGVGVRSERQVCLLSNVTNLHHPTTRRQKTTTGILSTAPTKTTKRQAEGQTAWLGLCTQRTSSDERTDAAGDGGREILWQMKT
jgi:hypothetical protein